MRTGSSGMITTIESCTLPTIAAISGAVTGGGAAIACACDLSIATQIGPLRLPDRAHARQLPVDQRTTRGSPICSARPGSRTSSSPRGWSMRRRAIASASTTSSSPTMPRCSRASKELAETIAGHAPLTMRATKEALRRLTQAANAEASTAMTSSPSAIPAPISAKAWKPSSASALRTGRAGEHERDTVGFIGLGLMGVGFVKRLLETGRSVVGCDLDAGRREEAEALGVALAASPAEVARAQPTPSASAVTTTKAVACRVSGLGRHPVRCADQRWHRR
jgi:hypothetical protein